MSLQYNAPKVAGRIFVQNGANQGVSTHSRPKAAGSEYLFDNPTKFQVSTHSRPKAAGAFRQNDYQAILFQHTAARRRLGIDGDKK